MQLLAEHAGCFATGLYCMQVVSSRILTKTSDVYSFGVLMWELFRCEGFSLVSNTMRALQAFE